MKRNISSRLLDWKDSPGRKPLLFYGARQVGKTYTLKEFGANHFEQLAYVDLEKNAVARAAFAQDLDPIAILQKLGRALHQTIDPQTTLLVLDEVQASNRALASLKYFFEDIPQLAVIAAGSLLGVAVNREGYSAPVGKVDTMTLHPLSFPEFLEAQGEESRVDEIRESFETMRATPFHEDLLDHYLQYLLVGGMPEAVITYLRTKDYESYARVQDTIGNLYIADMAKYAQPFETARIREVYDSIPSQLAKTNHKFMYKTIKAGARSNQYQGALSWLKKAGLINVCSRMVDCKAPLALHEDTASFKVYLNDTGLLSARINMTPSMALNTDTGTNFLQGAFTENYVMQSLTANNHKTWYWESKGKAQIDFLLQGPAGDVIPLEVKSSAHVRSRSLGVYIDTYKPKYAIRISTKNFGFENNIKSIPLYAVFCL